MGRRVDGQREPGAGAGPAAGPGFEARILDSMSSGIVAIDAKGVLAAWNAPARRILGWSGADPDSALGRDCRAVLRGQPGVARLLLEALGRKGGLSRAELALEPADDPAAPATIGFTLCPVLDPDGRVAGAAMLFRDLAPIERSDEQLRLRERLAALGQMAAGLAHAIRNPLAGMEVLAGLLRRRLADRPDDQKLVEELLVELRTLAGTVASCLEFVRPAAPCVDRVDPVRLLEEALAVARARVPFDGLVERAWDEGLPALEVDADQLRAALVDLIVNALQAIAEGGGSRLSLSVRSVDREGPGGSWEAPARPTDAPGGELTITVADDGPGVPEELREKIFYPFFTTRQRGSGVGLAQAQKIVASHGGRLELDSRPGRGCAFHLHLPVGSDAP